MEKTVKSALRAAYPDTRLKHYLCIPDQHKTLKLKLAAGAKGDNVCTWCNSTESFKHHCIECPNFNSNRKFLKDCTGFNVTIELLTKILPVKNQLLVNDFLVSISNQVRRAVATPPSPGARPMPQRGRVQVD